MFSQINFAIFHSIFSIMLIISLFNICRKLRGRFRTRLLCSGVTKTQMNQSLLDLFPNETLTDASEYLCFYPHYAFFSPSRIASKKLFLPCRGEKNADFTQNQSWSVLTVHKHLQSSYFISWGQNWLFLDNRVNVDNDILMRSENPRIRVG